MSTSNSIRRAVHFALLTSATASVAMPVYAQEQTTQQETTALQEVVVTGSRIPQPTNITSISPVTSVGADQVKIEGITRVEDLINNLPQAFADFGGNLSNGATGAATVNLRNLGSQRTLVLVNGRRLMPGDPTQNGASSPDLNQIPASLIERVEVLTGGASAVYGADAVGGVVNFLMQDDFEGVRLDAQYGFYHHDNDNSIGELVAAREASNPAEFNEPNGSTRDGISKDLTFILGMNTADGRGNATVYAGYRELDALLQSERDFRSCALNPTGDGTGLVCGGSGTTAQTRLQAIVQSGPNAGSNAGSFITNADGTLRPFATTDQYNFAPSNYYQRPDERVTAGLFAHYEVSEAIDVYTEFGFMNDDTTAQIAPAGLFFGGGPGLGGGYLVNCDNPFMSPAQVQTFCTNQGLGPTDVASIGIGKRNVEGGGRDTQFEHTSYRSVLGVRGEFAPGWTYDVYGLYGTTEYQQSYFNDFSIRRGGNALIVRTDPDTGAPACGINLDADLTNDDATCVPYNIFTPGGVTEEALGYVQIPGFQQGSTTETILSGAITGDFGQYGVKLPWASDGLGFAFGSEYRSEESELRNDVGFLTGDLSGQGGATLDTVGSYDVKEIFTELRLPLAQDLPGAHSIALEAGYRYSEYSLGFETDTYKLGADWAPTEDFRFRASYQRAVRAPNVQELFRPQGVQLDGTTDPCAGDAPTATLEQCALTGVTAGQYGNILANSAAQYNGLTGGNPDLDPETSDTYSFGFVLTPAFLPGFSLSADYFDILVEDTIGTVGADLAINTCLDSGDPFFCQLVVRAPGSGSLWLGNQGYIIDTTLNTGSLQTKGFDLEANYRAELGNLGGLSFQLIGTMVDEFVTEPLPDFPKYDCTGLYGTVCGTPIPEYRTKFRTTWSTPLNLDVTLTWRYLDGVEIDGTVDNPNFDFEGHPEVDETLGSRSYIDLAVSYLMETEVSAVTTRIGVNNLTDKDPPIVSQATCPPVFCSGNTFPQVYDALGRTVFIGVTADF
jgi:iron complex outermembrane recepter protein